MEKLFRRVRLGTISGKTVLVESLVFLGLYLIWALLGPQAAAQRAYLGHLSVFIPFITLSLEVVLLRKGMPPALRATWTLVALAFLFLALGRLSAFYAQLGSFLDGPIPRWLDLIQAGAYPFFFFALLVFPFENRYAPSRFRFLMDATIMSGATIALALLVFPVRPDFTGRQVLSLLLPILDLVLLVLVLNVFLANKLNRDTSAVFGLAFFCFLASDYLAYIAELTSGYQAGTPRDLGWILGSLLLGLVAVNAGEGKPGRMPQPARPQLGLRVQNILPVAMVLVLFWYVLTRWQYAGEISLFGLIMSLMLSLLLIVRMGIRAGEGELLVYWQLFSSIATPAILCDRQGRIQLVNPAALRELGIEEEKKALGRRLEAFFPVQETLQGMLANPGQTSLLIDTHLVGSGVPFSLMLSPIYAENRRILVAVTAYNLTQQRRQQEILEDANQELIRVSDRLEHLNARLESIVEERTTHLRRALKQLEAQNRLLRDLDQMKTEFVSLVSHELRTPLTSLHGGMELLLSKHNLPKKTRGPLALMQGEVMRLTRFVVNILDVSSVEAGKLHINMQPVPVGVLVGRVIQELSVQPGAGRIQVLLDHPELRVMADETVLHSILLHLLDNALKYAPQGEVQLLIATGRRRARFQVIDRGPGIPEQKRHLLFRRFQRLDTSDSQAVYGYGLGLYFSRKMVAAMKGKLTYARLPDGRSCFQFGLEAVDETQDPAGR